nr:hypothetical protein [Staphylococcus sp. GDY8P64P]
MTNYTPLKAFFSRRHIDKLKFNNHQALIKGQFSIINSTIQKTSLVLTTRFTDRESEVYLPSTIDSKNNNTSTFNFSVDIYNELIKFMKHSFIIGDVIDIYLKIDIQESFVPLKIKIGNPRILIERFLKGEIITDYQNDIISITPYFTMKGRNLSFRINRYTIDSYLTYIENFKKTNMKLPFQKIVQKFGLLGKNLIKLKIMVFTFLNIFGYIIQNYLCIIL